VVEILKGIRLVGAILPGRVGRQERSFTSADDVAQEVCMAVLKALPRTRPGPAVPGFVYGIAAHKVADAHRAMARDREEPVETMPEEAEPGLGPEQQAIQGELSREMNQLLDVLPAKQREIVVLRVVVGLSAEETRKPSGPLRALCVSPSTGPWPGCARPSPGDGDLAFTCVLDQDPFWSWI